MVDGFEHDNVTGEFKYNNVNVNKAFLQIRPISKLANMSVSNDVAGKVILEFAGALTDVRSIVDIAGTTDDSIIQIQNNGSNVLSTPMHIDSTETDSDDSATVAVISANAFIVGDIITIDVTQISDTAPKGLVISMVFNRTL